MNPNRLGQGGRPVVPEAAPPAAGGVPVPSAGDLVEVDMAGGAHGSTLVPLSGGGCHGMWCRANFTAIKPATKDRRIGWWVLFVITRHGDTYWSPIASTGRRLSNKGSNNNSGSKQGMITKSSQC